MRLPRNVAIVRIQEGEHKAILIDERLTPDQQLCARIFAAILAVETEQPFVILMKLDILAAMAAAA